MDALEFLAATSKEREEESDPHSISDQNPVRSTSQEQGSSNKVMELLYMGHLILNVIFGIVFALLAVLQWNEGSSEFDGATILICLVDFSVHILVWVLPPYMIGKNYAGLEPYMKTAALVVDVYSALLMANTEFIIIGMIPLMILSFIGALVWKSWGTGASHQHQKTEEVLSVKKLFELFELTFSSKSSEKLVCFAVISYLLQLSLVTWTQYKGQQGCTPILSDFLLFMASALGALGAMLESPLAGVDSRAVSIQVLPVLHKTCTVLLLVAVHTLAAEWLGEDMIYVCLPELIVVLVWFTICFGQPMSVSIPMSPKSQVVMGSVVAMLVYLTSWQENDRNMHVSCIIWLFWISLSSSALSGFHAWLLLGWPGSTSESNKLIHLLKVASTVGPSAALILCVSLGLRDPSISHESISSFQHKTIATVLSVFWSYLLYSYAARRHGHPETQTQRAPDKKYTVVGEVYTHMMLKKLYVKLTELLAQERIDFDTLFIRSILPHMVELMMTLYEYSSYGKDKSWIGHIHDLFCEIEDGLDTCAQKPTPNFKLQIDFRFGIDGMQKMGELHELLRNVIVKAPANPVGPVRLRDNIAKTWDKIFQVAFKLVSIVGIPGSEVRYMERVIKDRYYQLDVELKICLLYLSIFPVKQVIEVERLVRLWIAEGFIYGQHLRSTTDQEKVGIANGYIRELVRRKLIMHYSKGMKRTISIHPVVHSFIVSMPMEENFVTLVHSQEEDVSPSNGTARRLSLLSNGKEDQAAGRSSWKNLRSLTVFNNTSGIPVLAEMTRLHVLDLEGCKGPVCLDDLCQLLLLRYLSLRGTDVSELPADIGVLSCLQTLDVRSTKVKEIPPSILMLQKLLHLLAGNAKLPCGIGKMKTLFALSCPDVTTDSTSIMKEIGAIDNLVELELVDESGEVSDSTSIMQEVSNFDNLTELELICESGEVVTFESDRFHSLHKLSVQFGYSSLIFKTGALPNVQFLGLNLDKGLPEVSTRVYWTEPPQRSTSVAGIEHLQSLKNVHIKHSRDDTNAKAVVAAVESATTRHRKKPLVSVEVDEEIIVPRSWSKVALSSFPSHHHED